MCDKEGRISKVIDWGNSLSVEPMGFSLSRVEGFLGYISWPTWAAVEGERQLRQEFWRAYWDGVNISENDLHLRQKVKTTKDIGFVVETLKGCSRSDDVNPYQLLRLEGILMLSSDEMVAEPAHETSGAV
jgi:hypothetical protein